MRIVGYGDLVEVGRGGFGVIYRAHHQALDRIVAIKVLADTNLTQDQRQRFQREALAMAQLSWHPGIVTIYDTGITDTGQPYLAMEYLPNGSLGDQLRANGPLDPDTITHHGTQLADALQAAHDNGILHRDIKPDNVLVDPLGQPKLTDFGIAALADHTRSATNLLTGSVGHTAPELLEGQPATTASDIYALGSTLFELATGHPPFIRPDDDNLLAIALRTKTQPVPDLRPAGCPDTLATAIETAMAKDPHQRHPTPTDLANALTTAAPPPPPPPQPPTTRPRRRALIGATLVAIAATGTIAVAAITRTNNNPNATTTPALTPTSTTNDVDNEPGGAQGAPTLADDGIGVAMFGEPATQVIGRMEDLYGPIHDDQTASGCPLPTRWVEWGDLVLEFSPGPDGTLRAYSYLDEGGLFTDLAPRLLTDNGVTIGTTVEELRQLAPNVSIETVVEYGLTAFDLSDDPATATGLHGELTGEADVDIVRSISAGESGCAS